MEIQREKINAEFFTIVLKNDFEDGTNELKLFSDIFTKIKKEVKKVGYKKMFSVEEIAFIEEMSEYFVPPESAPGYMQEFPKVELNRGNYEEQD